MPDTNPHTLAGAIRLARTPNTALHTTMRKLVDCPVPDRWTPFPAWNTRTDGNGALRFKLALDMLRRCLPPHTARDYTLGDLVSAVLWTDKAGRRYTWPLE